MTMRGCKGRDWRGLRSSAISRRLAAADVLAPYLREAGLELLHHRDAGGVVEQHDLDSVSAQEAEVTLEGAGLPDDDSRDLEQQDRAGAHLARGQGGVESGAEVARAAAGVTQGGDLTVRHRVAVLDTLVVALAEHSRALGEDRPDRDAAGLQAVARLRQGQRHQFPVKLLICAHERLRYRGLALPC